MLDTEVKQTRREETHKSKIWDISTNQVWSSLVDLLGGCRIQVSESYFKTFQDIYNWKIRRKIVKFSLSAAQDQSINEQHKNKKAWSW